MPCGLVRKTDILACIGLLYWIIKTKQKGLTAQVVGPNSANGSIWLYTKNPTRTEGPGGSFSVPSGVPLINHNAVVSGLLSMLLYCTFPMVLAGPFLSLHA